MNVVRVRPVRTMGRVLLAGGALCLVAGLVTAGGAGADPNWDPADNAFLHTAHKGATNPGFTEGDCPTPPEGAAGDWGWHFVLPGNSTTFVTIDVDFQSYGFHQHVPFVAAPSAKHAYVYTPGPDTLLDARAVVDGTETEFVLSHVCPGSTSTTTTTEESTTTTEEVTTTTEEVTTTTSGGGSFEGSSTVPETSAQPSASVLGEEVARDALPRTGTDSGLLVVVGLALLLTGLVFVIHAGSRVRAAEDH